MIISDTYAFIQVPRTSSSTISGNLVDIHGGAEPDIHVAVGEEVNGEVHDISNRFVFGFVRNPYEREFSQWKYHSRKKGDVFTEITFEQWVLWRYRNLDLPESWFFDTTVYNYLRTFSRYPQLGFFLDNEGSMHTDFIGTYERRQEGLDFAYAQLGFTDQSGKTREQSNGPEPTSSYQEYYTKEMIELVTERYMPDLIAFGYSFEERESQCMRPDLVCDRQFRNIETRRYLHK